MKILSCGAGMQSSALHLMSCENALAKKRGEPPVWPKVPIYDISIFCDLGFEPPWVERQVKFLEDAARSCGIPAPSTRYGTPSVRWPMTWTCFLAMREWSMPSMLPKMSGRGAP